MFTNLFIFFGGGGVHQISRNMYCRFLILHGYLSPQFCHLVSNSRVMVLVADVKSFHIINKIPVYFVWIQHWSLFAGCVLCVIAPSVIRRSFDTRMELWLMSIVQKTGMSAPWLGNSSAQNNLDDRKRKTKLL